MVKRGTREEVRFRCVFTHYELVYQPHLLFSTWNYQSQPNRCTLALFPYFSFLSFFLSLTTFGHPKASQSHTWVLACLYNDSFNASDSSEVLNMSLTSKGCSSLAALRNPSRLLGKLGRPSRSKIEPSSSIHLHTKG